MEIKKCLQKIYDIYGDFTEFFNSSNNISYHNKNHFDNKYIDLSINKENIQKQMIMFYTSKNIDREHGNRDDSIQFFVENFLNIIYDETEENMEEMEKSHFLDKYNKLLILLSSEEDEEYDDRSQSDYYKKANNFIFKRKKKNISKNFIMDFSIENININNVRDLIKNKNDFTRKNEEFKMENNHSEILINLEKLSNNQEESIEAGELLNEINFTESNASTNKEKFGKKAGSIIKPTNTFNNRIDQDIEYQLDLERVKRKQRNKEIESLNNNMLCERRISANNIGRSFFNNKNFSIKMNLEKNIITNQMSNENLLNNIKLESLNLKIRNDEKDRKMQLEREKSEENQEIFQNEQDENAADTSDLIIDNVEIDNNKMSNININFTNYGVMNNNLINYQLPKSNNLNNKMLDLFKEINSKPKPSSAVSPNSKPLNSHLNMNSNETKNNIIDSIINSNINNLQNNLYKNYSNFNSVCRENSNMHSFPISTIGMGNSTNFNLESNLQSNNNFANKFPYTKQDDYFSEIFKSVENKNTIKSLSERINQLKKKNLFAESSIKGVNNTNNILNFNSKFSNLDKIFKNSNTNTNLINWNNNFPAKLNANTVKTSNLALLSKGKGNLQNYQISSQNNFDLLEAQLNSLKKKTTKTKNNINKLNNIILGDNNQNNIIKNFEEKTKNRLNYDKFNQSLEECEILINNLRESQSDNRKNANFLNNSNFDFDKI